jgi:hypothetical protein
MIEQRPHVLIELDKHPTIFRPNQAISGRYRLDMSRWRAEVQALEWSIAWATEGKGDLDQGVHAIGKTGASDEGVAKPDQWRRFETILPRSPLSYDGLIIKIHWRVRVRVVFGRKKEWVAELPFRLGNVDRAREKEGKTP